jgi:hypothetical protein
MLNTEPKAILFGALAGAAAAVLAGSILTQSSIAVGLFLISSFPIIVVGLSFGAAAGIIGAATAGVLVTLAVSGPAALVVLLTTLVPAALVTFLISLARPAEELGGEQGDTVWYPLADVVFAAAVAIAAGFVVLGVYAGYSLAFATEFATAMEAQFKAVNPDFVPEAGFAASLANFVYRAVPLLQPALMLFALIGSLYLALAVVRPSGRFARPKDDWPTMLRMPKMAVPAFGISMALTFLSGPLGLMATAFCGALGAGFAASGVAFLHQRSRGRPFRGLMLTLAYFAMFLFLPAVALFLLLGLFDTSRNAPVVKGPKRTLN